VKEVAVRLRTSTATVYSLCERGELAYVRVSTHAIRISETDVAEFIRRGAVGEREPPGAGGQQTDGGAQPVWSLRSRSG